jgi:hypothetical protein
LHWGFAFKHVFSDVQGTIAGAEFGDVWVSVVAGADYVSVDFKFSRCKSAWACWVAITFFVASESFQKVLEKFRVRVQIVTIGFGV